MPNTRPYDLRFVIQLDHPDSGVPEGLFWTASELRDHPHTETYHSEKLAEILSWFDVHLKRPTRFNRTNSKARFHRATKGISWLKAEAHEHIAVMREMAVIMGEYGHIVDQLETDRPGYIVYEDRYQIVAEPFADTPTSR